MDSQEQIKCEMRRKLVLHNGNRFCFEASARTIHQWRVSIRGEIVLYQHHQIRECKRHAKYLKLS